MTRHAGIATLVVALALSLPFDGLAQRPGAELRPSRADQIPYMEGCQVAHVIDGDTFNCADGRRVRLLLIDAPDKGEFGAAVRAALLEMLPPGANATLEFDRKRRDGDGRWLAYVYGPDGAMTNLVLVRQGYAFVRFDRDNRRHLGTLREAEREARAVGRGVWSE